MIRTALLTTGMVAAVGGAFVAGYFVSNYNNLKNTPEAVIAKMEAVKMEAKAEQEMAAKAKREAEDAVSVLRNTKAKYQAEIRPEIEEKVRRELEGYIAEADAKYDKAKKEHELATLKLELAREKDKDSSVVIDFYKTMLGGAN